MKCKNCKHKKSTKYIKGLLKLPIIKIKDKEYINVEDMSKIGDKVFG